MSDSTKLYNALYQNAEIGSSSIRKIFPKVQDSRLKNEMRMQLSNYKEQVNTIISQMRANNERPRPASKMTKMMTSMGITMNCARDRSTEHIAEMLIQGTNMGVIKINKALNNTITADPKLIKEAKSMLTKEQRYIDNLKSYL
ncbi:MAG: hypothetical protein J1F11_13135 [Oscillospiraceae bacterium]|nr:hypothetical protein [Oscillospiraceae bacterium]